MNFGDILDEWENSQKNISYKNQKVDNQNSIYKKKANADFIEQGFSNKKDAQKNIVIKKTIRQQQEEDSKKKINPMELWLRRYGTVDKDKVIEQYEQNKKMESREYVKDMPIDAYLDLHGMTRDEAWTRMDIFVNDCTRRGFCKIMFIHGKGNHSSSSDPVLGELVRLYIGKNKNLGASGHPNRNQGGSGATWVLIKINRK